MVKKVTPKKNWKELSYKEKLSYVLCIVSFTVGVILAILGMLIIPVGEISASVLTATGLFLAFCGSVIGIHVAYKSKFEDFLLEIEDKLHKKDEEQ